MICGVFTTTKKDLGNENKQLITRVLFSFFFFGGVGGVLVKSTIFYGWFVFCLPKKILEKSKKLHITRKISFKFLLGGPPEIVKSPAPPSPKNTKNFYVYRWFHCRPLSPNNLSYESPLFRSLSFTLDYFLDFDCSYYTVTFIA